MSGVFPLDWWTVPHALSGMILAALGLRIWWSLTILGGFELFEFFLRMVPTGDGPLFEYESASNVLADILVAVLGYVSVRAFLDSEGYRRHWGKRLRKEAV